MIDDYTIKAALAAYDLAKRSGVIDRAIEIDRALDKKQLDAILEQSREIKRLSGALKQYEPQLQAAYEAIRLAGGLAGISHLDPINVLPSIASVSSWFESPHGRKMLATALDFVSSEFEKSERVSVEGSIDEVAETVVEKIGHSPNGALSAEFQVSLFFAFLLFYISFYEAGQSETRITETLNKVEQRLEAQIEELAREEIEILVNDKNMYLRSTPNTDSEPLLTLPSHSNLKVISRDRDWVKVEYYDHCENRNIYGWAQSSHLVHTLSEEYFSNKAYQCDME